MLCHKKGINNPSPTTIQRINCKSLVGIIIEEEMLLFDFAQTFLSSHSRFGACKMAKYTHSFWRTYKWRWYVALLVHDIHLAQLAHWEGCGGGGGDDRRAIVKNGTDDDMQWWGANAHRRTVLSWYWKLYDIQSPMIELDNFGTNLST